MSDLEKRNKIASILPWLIMYCIIGYSIFDNYQQNRSLRSHLGALKSHNAWMNEVQNSLYETSTDMWKQAQTVKTWDQFLKENPRLVIPEDFEPNKLGTRIIIWPSVPEPLLENNE